MNDNREQFEDEQTELLMAKLRSIQSQEKPDPKFALRLRAQLSGHMAREEKQLLTQNFNFMSRFKFAIAGAVIAAVALIAVLSGSDKVLLPGKQEIALAGEGAFGALTKVSVSAKGQGGGGGGPADAALPAALEAERSSAGFGGGSSIMPVPTNYKFVYAGEDFGIDQDKMEVYRRVKGFGSVDFNEFISQFAVQIFDAGKFGQSKLEYFRVAEDRDFGYGLNVDLKEGTINISENWERWQTPDRQCQTPECYEQYRLRPEQIPADEAVIAATNAFLDEYGIGRENFGEPMVQNYWKLDYERLSSSDKMSYYIPDVVSVVYPLKVAGAEIYDEGGNKNGMFVTYSVRVNRVSSVSELTNQRYEASAYDVETDVSRIKAIAERGGFRTWYPYSEPGAKTEIVELNTPFRGLVRLWHDLGGKWEDIFVPSLIFPIKSAADGFYGSSVIVPLVKDVLDSQPEAPIIKPMPLPGLDIPEAEVRPNN